MTAQGRLALFKLRKNAQDRLRHFVSSFQMRQDTPNFVTVNVIAGPNYTPDVWRGVEESIKTLHSEMCVRVRVVEKLERSPGGKLKEVMSRVDLSSTTKPDC